MFLIEFYDGFHGFLQAPGFSHGVPDKSKSIFDSWDDKGFDNADSQQNDWNDATKNAELPTQHRRIRTQKGVHFHGRGGVERSEFEVPGIEQMQEEQNIGQANECDANA